MKRKFSVLMMMVLTLTSILTPGLLPITQVNAAAPQKTFYVSPTSGSDTNPGTETLPFYTLQKARDAVHAICGNMTGDIVVYLRGGTHTLADTLTFGQSDSGTNGYKVIYQNYPGETPVISGGQRVTGWTPQAGNIYKAHVGTSLNTRQLYVNGIRAIRARSVNGSGWEKSGAGFKCPAAVASWGNITDVEVVGRNMWKEFRGGIQSASGTFATMKQPFWTNANSHTDWPFPIQPDWIENAYELLDSEGEWYLNRTTGDLYYKPRAGEDMNTAEVIAPKLERLISGTSVKNVVFKGITFSYATWLRPNNAEGLADHQGVQTTIGQYTNFDDSREHWVQCDGNLEFTYSENLRFEGNTFKHLGGAGLSLNMGCKNNVVFNNIFEDISAHGIIIGYMHGYYADSANLVKNNLIDNNLISKTGQEYHAGMGIITYYTEHTVITHNELHDLPYTGISCGWGWGGHDPSVAKNNLIQNNLIYDIMKVLEDGGGIYTLSAQPGTAITGNVIHDDRNNFGAIYLDDLSRYITVQDNAVYSNVKNVLCKGSNHNFQYNYWVAAPNPEWWWQTDSTVANNSLIANAGQIPSSITGNAGRNGQETYINMNNNIASGATVTVSSALAGRGGNMAVDFITTGCVVAAVEGYGDWVSNETTNAWINLQWGSAKTINQIVLYDRSSETNQVTSGRLTFSDGSYIDVGPLDDRGKPVTVNFSSRTVTSARFTVTGVKTGTTKSGLAEIQVFEGTGTVTPTPTPTPTSTPTSTPGINLALNKTATAYYIDGSAATMHSGHEAGKAVDGNSGTWAQAMNQYVWIEQVDTGDSYNINRVKVTFRSDTFATDYDIKCSANGEDWDTVATVNGHTAGGTYEHIFNAEPYRYVRVQAIKPDAAGQPGAQMAISELEVYADGGATPTPTPTPTSTPSTNIALGKPASAYYIDGSTATMHTGFEANKAVDGNMETRAQAMLQYAWIAQVDLQDSYNIYKVKVTFASDAFATDYYIKCSANGENWDTVATVNGHTAGGTYEHTFSAELYRYVRVQAIKPDAANQLGGQMAISELEVYY